MTTGKEAEATDATRQMEPIPILEGKRIAEKYGYDQVVIYARRVGTAPAHNGEHMTTFGRTAEHCGVAARIGATLQRFMGWEV